MMNIFTEFEKKLKKAIQNIDFQTRDDETIDLSKIIVEVPKDSSHGDLATNAALILAKFTKESPRQIAAKIESFFKDNQDILSINIAGPGFINFRFTKDYWQNFLAKIFQNKEDYGRSQIGKGRKVNVEYVSANPTGPLHIGHCRGAVVGDVIANLLNFTNHDITKEYYINDAGNQIDILSRSVYLRYCQALGKKIDEIPQGLYPGEYLIPVGEFLAKKYKDLYINNEKEALPIFKKEAVEKMMDLIKEDLSTLKIEHDVFFSEKTLHDNDQKAIHDIINLLKEKNYIYKGTLPPPKGQANEDWENREQLLFRTTDHGDDQDRALVKSDGSFTYYAADIAYFYNKYKRGFEEMIYILGADHSGYVKRLETMAAAISNNSVRLTGILCQLVKLYRDNIPVKMSKRSGNFITLREVVSEVGADPIRFMMLFRKADIALDFDILKVKEQSKDNPVFYVQYAHARTFSIFRQSEAVFGEDFWKNSQNEINFSLLNHESELTLIKKIAEYPKLIEMTAIRREPHRLAFYLYDLASLFHAQWHKGNENKDLRFIIEEKKDLTISRLALVKMLSNVLKSGLDLIGVNAPESMN